MALTPVELVTSYCQVANLEADAFVPLFVELLWSRFCGGGAAADRPGRSAVVVEVVT